MSVSRFAWRQNDLERASEAGERALAAFRSANDVNGEAWALRELAAVAERRRDFERADSLYEQSAALFEEIGEERALLMVVGYRGTCALERGDYARAREFLEESLARARAFGSEQTVGDISINLGLVALHERRYEDSVPLFAQSLETSLEHGVRIDIPLLLRCLAATVAVRGDVGAAAQMLGAADVLQEDFDEMHFEIDDAYVEAVGPVLERADEPDIAAAWAAGRGMSESEAVAFALAAVAENVSG